MTLHQIRLDLTEAMSLLRGIQQEITDVENPPRTASLDYMTNEEKRLRARQALGTLMGRPSKSTVHGYTLKHSQRGRVPAWVLKQAKVRNKPALRAKFKDGHRFVKV